MISAEIIKIASRTTNVGLTNNYTFRTTKKNSLCGDIIKIELTEKNSKINSMKYETQSCIYCEASASLLSEKIKNLSIENIKKDLNKLKNVSLKKKDLTFPKKFIRFKSLIKKDHINRLNCIFLPLDAVLKALKK